MSQNINVSAERSSFDICGYETHYPFAGFYEGSSRITGHVHNNPDMINGIQATVVKNIHTCRTTFFIRFHKHHTMGEGLTRQGPNYLRVYFYTINSMLMGE